jgi:hypothetical protein
MSDDPHLFRTIVPIFRSDSRFMAVGDGLLCDGSAAPLTNIYPIENLESHWEDWQPNDSGMRNPAQMSSLIFETRSAAWVAEVGLLLAHALEAQAWFVDAGGVAWPVGEVDPGRIALA